MKAGEKYNNWTIISLLEPCKHRKCVARCECGREFVRYCDNIKKNKCCVVCTKNKHGESRNKLYFVWAQMKGRCSNQNNPEYHNYGGRGIKVCEDWKNSANFLKWAHESGYKEGLTIDRINVNGNYCPENCRWTNFHIQNTNKRISKRNKSGYLGIFKLSGNRKKPWQVDVGKTRVGYCATLEEAVEMRKKYILDNNLTEYESW